MIGGAHSKRGPLQSIDLLTEVISKLRVPLNENTARRSMETNNLSHQKPYATVIVVKFGANGIK